MLISYLERIAERVESFYVDLAAVSLYCPQNEANPSRARWKFIQRRIKDGSFFVLTRTMVNLNLDAPIRAETAFEAKRNKRQSISFDQVLSQAVSNVSSYKDPRHGRNTSTASRAHSNSRQVPPVPPLPIRPLRLAEAHTARAQGGPGNSTTYEEQILTRASNKMSQFMNRRMKDIHRLSKSTNMLSLEHAMAVYGRGAPRSDSGSDDSDVSPTSTAQPLYSAPSRLGGRSTAPPSEFGGSVISRAPSNASMASNARSVKAAMSRSQLHSATFSRKLSVYRPNNGTSQSETVSPVVPSKPSHW